MVIGRTQCSLWIDCLQEANEFSNDTLSFRSDDFILERKIGSHFNTNPSGNISWPVIARSWESLGSPRKSQSHVEAVFFQRLISQSSRKTKNDPSQTRQCAAPNKTIPPDPFEISKIKNTDPPKSNRVLQPSMPASHTPNDATGFGQTRRCGRIVLRSHTQTDMQASLRLIYDQIGMAYNHDPFEAAEVIKAYHFLGIAFDADQRAIKKAYYGFARRLHDDNNPNVGDGEKLANRLVFTQATDAYDLIKKIKEWG